MPRRPDARYTCTCNHSISTHDYLRDADGRIIAMGACERGVTSGPGTSVWDSACDCKKFLPKLYARTAVNEAQPEAERK